MSQDTLFKCLGYTPLLLCVIGVSFIFDWDYYVHSIVCEDGPIENATVIFSLMACLCFYVLAWTRYRQEGFSLPVILLGILGAGMFFFAGEEISWGQRIFGIETEKVSHWLAEKNRQNELNLHNISGFSKVRLLADIYCVFWGICIPWYYQNRTFPISWLRPFLSPAWLIPGYLAVMLISWPKKICEIFFAEDKNFNLVGMGELKEAGLGLALLLYAIHIGMYYRSQYIHNATTTETEETKHRRHHPIFLPKILRPFSFLSDRLSKGLNSHHRR